METCHHCGASIGNCKCTWVVPIRYTSMEGEAWKDWKLGEIRLGDLPKYNPEKWKELYIHGRQVHSLKFNDGREWDYVNGWRDELCNMPGCSQKLDDKGRCLVHNRGEILFDPDPKQSYNLGDCLKAANEVINGDRQDTYGSPEDSFALIAQYWQVYLDDAIIGRQLNAKDVAHMMILFKIARCSGQKPSRDNYIDICGYSSIIADRLI